MSVLAAAVPALAQITITTAAELQNMNLDLAGDYVLGNDIDASSILNFDPVGDAVTKFTGTFDGQGHTITGLTINRPGEDYVGLFGYIDFSATIQNVHLADTNVTGNDNVGSILGYNLGNISYCTNTGSVTGNDRVGGIVGYCQGNTLNCQNRGDITGNFYTGGIVGGGSSVIKYCYNLGDISGSDAFTGGIAGSSMDIMNCYNSGNITGTTYGTGGIAGVGYFLYCYNTGTVLGNLELGGIGGYSYGMEYCYNTGAVAGINSVGGLIGVMQGDNEYCYNMGLVTGTGADVGGLVGTVSSVIGGTSYLCYWDIETSGQSSSPDEIPTFCEGKTTAEMMQQTTYSYWNFSTIWGMACDGSSYPYLRDLPPDPIMNPVNVTINQGASQADPTDIALITFDVTFEVPVTDFDNGDVDFTGSTALIADAVVTDTGDGMHYTVAVTPSTEGTVVVSIPAGVLDLCSIATNTASTSTDNTVVYMTELPTVPLAAWSVAAVLLAAGVCVLRRKQHKG